MKKKDSGFNHAEFSGVHIEISEKAFASLIKAIAFLALLIVQIHSNREDVAKVFKIDQTGLIKTVGAELVEKVNVK